MNWAELTEKVTEGARKFWDVVRRDDAAKFLPERLARQWGRLNFQSVVRHVPKGAVFVHCHECRWPVTPGRYGMLHGLGPSHIPATEEQMQRICEGVRRHMGVK